ncbi:MAG: recombinase XerC, partial [Ruminococcus sp.]|nr:recombinase XerC [Ruminococcus sp.]
MAAVFQDEAFPILKDYLYYKQTIQNKSLKTVDEYFIDLRTFFRYMKIRRGIVSADADFDSISITDITQELVTSVTLNDAYEYMNYLIRERDNKSAARARKCSSLKGFYNYLHKKKHLIETNPLSELETPKIKKAL